MNITIITLGTRGDVQPFVNLAHGLQQHGHSVRIATQPPFEEFVGSNGVEFAPLGHRVTAVDDFNEFARDEWAAGKHARRIVKDANRRTLELLDDQLVGGFAACEDADLLIEGPMGVMTPHFAERLDVPFVRAQLRPETRTGSFRKPDLLHPDDSRLAARNRASYSEGMEALWRVIRPTVNEWRETNGLKSWSGSNPIEFHHYERRFPVLNAFSELVSPRPDDYPPWHHVMGFWPLEAPRDWEPPAHIVSFLQAGPPPLCLGFGSTPVLDALGVWYAVVEALPRIGQRAIVLTGWGGLERRGTIDGSALVADHRSAHDNLAVANEVPHDWIYARCAVAIHPGGAGSTSASLHAGIPTVTVPFLWDQLYWGQRVHALGVGPQPIIQTDFDNDRLAQAVKVASASEVDEAAADLSEALRKEKGVERAVEVLEETASAGRGACLERG